MTLRCHGDRYFPKILSEIGYCGLDPRINPLWGGGPVERGGSEIVHDFIADDIWRSTRGSQIEKVVFFGVSNVVCQVDDIVCTSEKRSVGGKIMRWKNKQGMAFWMKQPRQKKYTNDPLAHQPTMTHVTCHSGCCKPVSSPLQKEPAKYRGGRREMRTVVAWEWSRDPHSEEQSYSSSDPSFESELYHLLHSLQEFLYL